METSPISGHQHSIDYPESNRTLGRIMYAPTENPYAGNSQPDIRDQKLREINNATYTQGVYEQTGHYFEDFQVVLFPLIDRHVGKIRMHNPQTPIVFADLGSGSGEFARIVNSRYGPHTVTYNVDLNDRLPSDIPGIPVQANIFSGEIPLRDDSVHFVNCKDVLVHGGNVNAPSLLREVHRILRPGGVAFFTSVENNSPVMFARVAHEPKIQKRSLIPFLRRNEPVEQELISPIASRSELIDQVHALQQQGEKTSAIFYPFSSIFFILQAQREGLTLVQTLKHRQTSQTQDWYTQTEADGKQAQRTVIELQKN